MINAIPILTILFYERKFFWFLIGVLLSSFFHNTAWFLLFFIPVFLVYKKFNLNLIILFVISAFAYILLGRVVFEIVERLLPGYSHYLNSHYAESHSISLFITKIYYLPLIVYFYMVYKKDSSDFGEYFHFMVFIFTLTFWFFLLALNLGIATRFYYYVVFFMVFPIYYLLHKSYKKGKIMEFVMVLGYVILPYLAKVTFLAKAEFLYNSVLWR